MKRSYVTIILILLIVCQATAQLTISGTIKDKADNEPIVGANIYIHQSQIGTVSDINGRFTLKIPEKEKTLLFISFVGYKTIQLTIPNTKVQEINVFLEEDQVKLTEYQVNTNPDKKWAKNLKRFERLFLGNDRFSRSCKILNPWILEFEYQGRNFKAHSNQVLNVENKATGYMVAYKLNQFYLQDGILVYEGLISFQELTTGNEKEEKEWHYNRRLAYGGSLRHYLKSAVDDELGKNGFSSTFLNPFFYKIKNIYTPEEMAEMTPNEPVKTKKLFRKSSAGRILSFSRRLRIFYYGDIQGERVQLSDIELKNEVVVDEKGMLESPASVITYGQMAKENFAYLLPLEYDYVPNEEGVFKFNKEIVEPYENFICANPTEQLHLHTDKSQYVDGEKVWFKAYANINESVSKLSSKLYVQLLQAGQPLVQLLVPMTNGTAYGALSIPEGIDDGTYLIKAYTDWTDTLEDNLHFYKKIKIGLAETNRVGRKNPLSLKVFPEGGHLVEGLQNKVAFELKNNQQQFINSTLELIDEEFEVLQTIYPTWEGKGTFVFTPEENRSYTLRMKSKRGITADLSPSIGLSANMQVNGDGPTVEVLLQSTKPRQTLAYLMITSGDRIVSIRNVAFKEKDVIKVNHSTLYDGVNQFTLFDKDFKPLAERLYFKYPEQKSDLNIKVGALTGSKRSAAEIVVRGKDKIRSASLSVSNADLFESDLNESIWVSTYLRPYIAGNIVGFEPNFIKNETFRQQMDLLMLVNGWRKYDWDKIKQTKEIERDTIIQQPGLDISGLVTKGARKIPMSNEPLYLITGDSASSLYQTFTDTDGRFTFNNVIYSDSTDLIFRLMSEKKSVTDLQFEFDSIAWYDNASYVDYLPAGESPQQPATVVTKRKEFIELTRFGGRTYVLKDAVISAPEPEPELFAIPRLVSEKEGRFLSMEDVSAGERNNVFNMIDTRFPNIKTIHYFESGVTPRWKILANRSIQTQPNAEVLILVDNFPVSAEYIARKLNPQEIESIQVLTQMEAAIFGPAAANGAVVIYTKRNKTEILEKLQNFAQVRLKGYQAYKAFYSPDYLLQTDPEPDYRTTLYWNPNVVNDKRWLRYYNSDLTGRMKAILEGYTVEGIPFRSVQYYTVEEQGQ